MSDPRGTPGHSWNDIKEFTHMWNDCYLPTVKIKRHFKATSEMVYTRAKELGLRSRGLQRNKGKIVFFTFEEKPYESVITQSRGANKEMVLKRPAAIVHKIVRNNFTSRNVGEWTKDQDKKIIETQGKYKPLCILATRWRKDVKSVGYRYLAIRQLLPPEK